MIVDESSIRRQEVLCFIQALVKCTKTYFYGANNAPCLLANYKKYLKFVSSILQLSFIIVPKV
jgi:hypothetical protein